MSDVFVLCCFNGDRRLIFLGKQIIKSLSPTKTFSFEETSILEDFTGNGGRKYWVYRFLSLQLQGYDNKLIFLPFFMVFFRRNYKIC